MPCADVWWYEGIWVHGCVSAPGESSFCLSHDHKRMMACDRRQSRPCAKPYHRKHYRVFGCVSRKSDPDSLRCLNHRGSWIPCPWRGEEVTADVVVEGDPNYDYGGPAHDARADAPEPVNAVSNTGSYEHELASLQDVYRAGLRGEATASDARTNKASANPRVSESLAHERYDLQGVYRTGAAAGAVPVHHLVSSVDSNGGTTPDSWSTGAFIAAAVGGFAAVLLMLAATIIVVQRGRRKSVKEVHKENLQLYSKWRKTLTQEHHQAERTDHEVKLGQKQSSGSNPLLRDSDSQLAHGGGKILPEPIRKAARYDFEAGQDDELEVMVDDILCVEIIYDDGWCLGLNESTGAKGMFPLDLLNSNESTPAQSP